MDAKRVACLPYEPGAAVVLLLELATLFTGPLGRLLAHQFLCWVAMAAAGGGVGGDGSDGRDGAMVRPRPGCTMVRSFRSF